MFAPTRRKAVLLLGGIGLSKFALGDPVGASERDVVIAYVVRLVELAKPASKDLVLASMTTSFEGRQDGLPTLAELRGDIPETAGITAREFLRANAAPVKLEIPSKVLAHWSYVRVVDDATLSQIFEKSGPGGGWKQLYKLYPNASVLIRLSRVGIDDQARQALFSVSSGGMTRGISMLVLMQYRDGAWRQFKQKRVPDALAVFLVGMNQHSLDSASETWSQTEELQCSPRDVQPVLAALRDLADRQTRAEGLSLHLWGSV